METEVCEQKAVIFFGLCVTGKDEPATVSGREIGIKDLDGRELFKHGAWGKSRGILTQTMVQSDVQAIGKEGDEDVGFDTIFELMEDGADG